MAAAAQLDKALEKFASGVEVNFKGSEVPASKLAETIREVAQSPDVPVVLTVINAKIVGSLNLNGLGENGQALSLQIMGCHLAAGFQARGSRWRRLIIAKTTLATWSGIFKRSGRNP